MLFKHDKNHVDLSLELSDEIDWQAGTLRHARHHLDITAFATDPVSGLLVVGARFQSCDLERFVDITVATGSSAGNIVVYGTPGVECSLHLSDPPGARVSFLSFAQTLFRLLCVGSMRNHISLCTITECD